MSVALAFIGLGTMGFPMAGHLATAGYRVTVFNRSTEKAVRWCERYPGARAATPALAATGADVVMLCVGNDEDVRAVCYGDDGVMSAMQPGAVLVDHTTTSAKLARELYQAAKEKGICFVDAPVSGGQSGAELGQLTVMAGGDEAVLEQVRSLLESYSRAVTWMGPSGAGQQTKMVNQLCIAGILQGLSEGLCLAMQAGLEIPKLVEVLKLGAAGSWQLENRAETMARGEFDFGFAVDWMRKDLAICFAEAETLGVELPLAHQVDEIYAQLQQRGFNRCDTSVLIKQFEQSG